VSYQITMATPIRPSSRQQLPLQAAPIDRNLSPAAAGAGGVGVEAAGWFDEIVNVVKTVAPIATTVASAFSDRALKRDITPVDWSR
jgi:hypothetical protein